MQFGYFQHTLQGMQADCCLICCTRDETDVIHIIRNLFTGVPFSPVYLRTLQFHQSLSYLFQFKYYHINPYCQHTYLQIHLQRLLGPHQAIQQTCSVFSDNRQNQAIVPLSQKSVETVIVKQITKTSNILQKSRRTSRQLKGTRILQNWFNEHIDSPYPSQSEREQLRLGTGINHKQIQNWFSNQRRKYVQSKRALTTNSPSPVQDVQEQASTQIKIMSS